jgi:hypothetical protein
LRQINELENEKTRLSDAVTILNKKLEEEALKSAGLEERIKILDNHAKLVSDQLSESAQFLNSELEKVAI